MVWRQSPPEEEVDLEALAKKQRLKAIAITAALVLAAAIYGWFHPPVEKPWQKERKEALLQLWMTTEQQRDAAADLAEKARAFLEQVRTNHGTREEQRAAQFWLDTAEAKVQSLDKQLQILAQDMRAAGYGKKGKK